MSPSAASTFTVVAGGDRLEAAWFGMPDPARAPIVMLHEGLGSVALWKDFPARLAAATGRATFAYSRAGYGQSDPLVDPRAPAYMHREAYAVLPEVLSASRIDDAVFFGHSDGASIALLFAGRFPERVRALVVEAPHVFVEDVSVASIAQAKVAFETTDLPAKLGRYHADVRAAFYGWNDIWLDARFRGWNIEAALDGIAAPVLAIQGTADEYGTLAQLDAIAARAPSMERLVLPGCRHSPHRDDPDAVLAAIATFLERRVAGR